MLFRSPCAPVSHKTIMCTATEDIVGKEQCKVAACNCIFFEAHMDVVVAHIHIDGVCLVYFI